MAESLPNQGLLQRRICFENVYIFTPTSLTRETTIPELKDILSA